MSVKNENAAGGESVVLDRPVAGGVYASLFEKINLNPVSTLSALDIWQDAQAMSDATADERLTAGMQVFLECLKKSGSKVEKLDKNLIDHHIAELDYQISRQLDAVMHHDAFQAVEGLWRGVKSLVDKTDFRQNVKVELLDMSKEDLRQDFEDSPEIIQSGLYKHTYIDEYDTPGGEPIAALISAYEFDASAQDVALLRNISKVSAAAHMPFIGSAGPAFFLKDSMEDVAAIKDIGNYFDRAEYIKWKSFRETDDSRYIGLVMPRVLGRLPYGPDTVPVRSFNYVEEVKGPDHDKYLWTNASFAFASNMVRSFINNGWCVQIRGPQAGGAVQDLPIHLYDLGTGNQVKIPSEVMIPETREFEFANLGFIPLSYYKNRDYREAGDDASPEPETETGAFYARLHHERELNRSARIHLFSNAAHLTPGQVLEPQGDVITALQEGMILTLVTFRGARDSRLHVSVWGQPYTERYCFRPVEIPRPVIPGTLPARIESREKNDTYAHLDEQGRYRVKLDFDREGTEAGYGYLWLRMAKPYAGETLGWHTPLIDGTDVAIAYSNGDIDLPYIAYAQHDSEHPDLVNRDNHTRNILRTPANNKLRMEDKRGEEHIKLATEYGRTQLNSGHLVDSKGQLRGKGTELRTDEWGTLRAGKGLFVAADAQAKAHGDALDMDAALKEIDRLNQQLQQLEMAAEQAQALKADVDSQIQMFEQRLKPLNEAVLFSAPEGMALTSGEDMQLVAAQNVAINAGGDISVGTMGNTTLLTGEKLGLFARTGQLSLKSGEGPVDAQAQNASLRLFAEKKLTMSSASDISFAGKKRITLIGGGSYLRLEAGRVEYGTTATYIRKVKRTMAAGAATLPLNIPEMYPAITGKICIPCLLKAIQANDAIVQGA
ncbi:type VI secretion system contractile sheath large subunit [Kluyvera sichuanensis]|uniref:type VI secretion system contractile sheath large subunit n=1 Tax=Kluyvera sichuanensis TaxID=2725494 RepID=UPI0039F5B7E5